MKRPWIVAMAGLATACASPGPSPEATATRQAAMKTASDPWAQCAGQTANTFARNSAEPAEVVADAAMGQCIRFEMSYRIVIRPMFANSAQVGDTVRKAIRDVLIGEVIKLRANPGRPITPLPAPTPTQGPAALRG